VRSKILSKKVIRTAKYIINENIKNISQKIESMEGEKRYCKLIDKLAHSLKI